MRHLSYLQYVVIVGIHRNARVYVLYDERSREAVLREAAQDSGKIDAPFTGRQLDLFRRVTGIAQVDDVRMWIRDGEVAALPRSGVEV